MRRGRVIAGKYRLESPLARGGMGSVWTARHILLDAPVAIKFIVPSGGGSEAGRTRFEREAKAAAMLQSPHVVRIYDYGVEAETPYLVMERLEGQDLAERLAERGRLSLPETVAIVTQVARALRRAAEAAIVHRDLKPSNVFIVGGDEEDGGEIVKVLDFGVAKAPRISLSGDITRNGTIVGSPRYMSPEQARSSGAVDHRSDLWSLAVIAYRALTGRVPFPGDELAEVILNVCTERPPPPSQIAPELGPEIDEFFARALDRDPGKRFQTARALALAFAAAAGEEPPPSAGPSSLRAGAAPRPPSREPDAPMSPDAPRALADEATRPALKAVRAAPSAESSRTLPDGDTAPRSSEPFVLRHPRWPDAMLTPSADAFDVSTRGRPRRPWHVRLRQGLAGAAIAAIVVGGAMSMLLWDQRGAWREIPASASAPPTACVARPPRAPTRAFKASPALLASAPLPSASTSALPLAAPSR
jgi:eukaryotic-like serine/threonine-protein kinase